MYTNPNQTEEFIERYQNLPPDIRELLDYGIVDKVIEEVAVENRFTKEQEDILRMEIELVLYMFLPRQGFINRIKESLEIETSIAEIITAYIDQELFSLVEPIMNFLDDQFTPGKEVVAGATLEGSGIEEVLPSAEAASALKEFQAPADEIEPAPTFAASAMPPSTPVITPEQPTITKPDQTETPRIPAIHTFESDAKNVHGYGVFVNKNNDDEEVHRSTQDDVIGNSSTAESK